MRRTTLCLCRRLRIKSRLRLLALLMIGSAGPAGGLVAQVAGLPVRNAGVAAGLGIAGDIGFSNAAAGKGVVAGVTGAIGLGPFGITGTVAAGSTSSAGFTGNLRVFGGRLPVSLTLQAGAAYDKTGGSNNWTIPLGVGLALTIRNPAFSIKPWVAPRVNITGDSPDEQHAGISGGVDLGLPSGLTLRAMYDRLSAGAGIHPSVLSLGVGFTPSTRGQRAARP